MGSNWLPLPPGFAEDFKRRSERHSAAPGAGMNITVRRPCPGCSGYGLIVAGSDRERLIAAAPDLLAALEGLVAVLDGGGWIGDSPEPGSPGYIARAAIAKARGE